MSFVSSMHALEEAVAFRANVINVMIASPTDVPDERQVIRDVIQEWNAVYAHDKRLLLLPVGWESHAAPEMGERGQGIINRTVLSQCDLLVAVFWKRLGSPTGGSPSGTVEEIRRHLDADKPAMIYFSDAQEHLSKIDPEQYAAVREFRTECETEGLVESFDSREDFRTKFSRQLALRILNTFGDLTEAPGNDRHALYREPPSLSDKAKELLLAAVEGNGMFLCLEARTGMALQVGNRNLCPPQQDPRTRAAWKAAVDQLHHAELVEFRGNSRDSHFVTFTGFEFADQLRGNQG